MMAYRPLPVPHAPPLPGGHCIEPCSHAECQRVRAAALHACLWCMQSIGYGQRFDRDPATGWLYHVACAQRGVVAPRGPAVPLPPGTPAATEEVRS